MVVEGGVVWGRQGCVVDRDVWWLRGVGCGVLRCVLGDVKGL